MDNIISGCMNLFSLLPFCSVKQSCEFEVGLIYKTYFTIFEVGDRGNISLQHQKFCTCSTFGPSRQVIVMIF